MDVAPSPGPSDSIAGTAPASTERPGRRAATVEFEHVTKVYGRAEANTPGAVNDLSLFVPAGRICVLVGPSGCGKTTSLKMVNRLIEPTSGRILIDGVDAATREVTELRRGIGYVIQSTGLFPHQTIGENVAVVPRLLGWDAARQRERTDELLGLVGLDPARYRDRYPSQLSGGERQRVGVARALAADPPVMLMDEPFGAVDPIVRDRLQNEFLRLQEELAKTILFVTHDIDEAIKMGDLVAVMQAGGTLAQFGTPAEILANPASDFVARFVGADRGLKRLSLVRVGDLGPTADRRRPSRRRRRRRGPAPRGRPVPRTCSSSTSGTGRSAGSTRVDLPAVGTLDGGAWPARCRRCSSRGRRSRTPCRCSSAPTSRPGSSSTAAGRVQGIVTLDAIVEELRAPRRARGPGMIRWDWIRDNLGVDRRLGRRSPRPDGPRHRHRPGDQLRRRAPHPPSPDPARPDHRDVRRALHDPEPRPVRVPRPVHRADPGHRRDRPDQLHAADPDHGTSWPGSTASRPRCARPPTGWATRVPSA